MDPAAFAREAAFPLPELSDPRPMAEAAAARAAAAAAALADAFPPVP
jgi:hypothetical protein